MDFWWTLFQIRKAQYGDTNFGHDTRKQERKERQMRMRIIKTSRAPCHAGFDWSEYRETEK